MVNGLRTSLINSLGVFEKIPYEDDMITADCSDDLGEPDPFEFQFEILADYVLKNATGPIDMDQLTTFVVQFYKEKDIVLNWDTVEGDNPGFIFTPDKTNYFSAIHVHCLSKNEIQISIIQ